MSDMPDQQPLSRNEQVAQIDDKLRQVKELLDAPDFTMETYQQVTDLTSQIRSTIIETRAYDNDQYIRNQLLESVNSGVRMTLFYRLQTDPPQRNGQELTHPLGHDGSTALVLSPFTTRSFMRKLLPLMVITSA
jgi:hypothetical protein